MIFLGKMNVFVRTFINLPSTSNYDVRCLHCDLTAVKSFTESINEWYQNSMNFLGLHVKTIIKNFFKSFTTNLMCSWQRRVLDQMESLQTDHHRAEPGSLKRSWGHMWELTTTWWSLESDVMIEIFSCAGHWAVSGWTGVSGVKQCLTYADLWPHSTHSRLSTLSLPPPSCANQVRKSAFIL